MRPFHALTGALTCLLLGCGGSAGGADAASDVEAEVYTCPTASATWVATSGTCPERGATLIVAAHDCVLGLTAFDGAGPTFTGAFTSAVDFQVQKESSDTTCTGVWSGLSADLTCRVGAQVCTLRLEPPCPRLSGTWTVTSGMCFALEARLDLVQGIDCDVADAPGGVQAGLVASRSLTFTHPEHGACQAATDGTLAQGTCADGCTFEWRKIR